MPTENPTIKQAKPEVNEQGKARRIFEMFKTIARSLFLPLAAISINSGPNIVCF